MKNYGFIDSHCHLVHDAYTRPQDYVQRAKDAGLVAALVNTGMKADHAGVLKLCEANKGFLFAVIGVSPYDAVTMSKEELELHLSYIEKHRRDIVAIGEIGLDFHHFTKKEDFQAQERVFRAQLELAKQLDLPVVMHTRKAERESFEIFKEYKINGMLHCFFLHEVAVEAIKTPGVLVSLPTLKNKDRDRIIRDVPLDRLVCETDSPYLWPVFPSEPLNVIEVYDRIASKKQVSLGEVKRQVFQNVNSFFKLHL